MFGVLSKLIEELDETPRHYKELGRQRLQTALVVVKLVDLQRDAAVAAVAAEKDRAIAALMLEKQAAVHDKQLIEHDLKASGIV
jgi:hypothetical protein